MVNETRKELARLEIMEMSLTSLAISLSSHDLQLKKEYGDRYKHLVEMVNETRKELARLEIMELTLDDLAISFDQQLKAEYGD